MARASGFTDAELAAAAWRRNLKLQSTLLEEVEKGKGSSAREHHEYGSHSSSRTRRKGGSGGEVLGGRRRGEGRKSKRKRSRKERGRSANSSRSSDRSVDSFGRERKRRGCHSPSPGGRRHGWLISRSRSGSRSGTRGRRRSWSNASSRGSFGSDKDVTGNASDSDESWRNSPGQVGSCSPGANWRGSGCDLPPPDPLR
ncbi:unnamed protein product [Discosporangium mesarthrocarpum]